MSTLKSRLEALEAKQPVKPEAVFIEDAETPLQNFEVCGGPLSRISRADGESAEEFRQKCRDYAAEQPFAVVFFQYKNQPHDMF